MFLLTARFECSSLPCLCLVLYTDLVFLFQGGLRENGERRHHSSKTGEEAAHNSYGLLMGSGLWLELKIMQVPLSTPFILKS